MFSIVNLQMFRKKTLTMNQKIGNLSQEAKLSALCTTYIYLVRNRRDLILDQSLKIEVAIENLKVRNQEVNVKETKSILQKLSNCRRTTFFLPHPSRKLLYKDIYSSDLNTIDCEDLLINKLWNFLVRPIA